MQVRRLIQFKHWLRKKLEYLSAQTAVPGVVRVTLIDWALWLDRGTWFGSLWQLPKFWALWLGNVAQKHQLNQLGNPDFIPEEKQNFMQRLEHSVIAHLRQQLHAPAGIGGYCTVGGSEANTFLLWSARSQFEHQSVEKVVVLGTALTHYSVTKAARILQLPFVTVAVANDYTFSPEALEAELMVQYHKGVRGFAMVVTWGYSSTGGCDDWKKLEKVLKKFQKTHLQTHFFVWIDAAAQGLPLLYLSAEHKHPFRSAYVQGYVVDYHKFGGAPMGSGVVLYRKKVSRHIVRAIPYLKEVDATLLGSRSGSAVLAIWACQQLYSQKYWHARFTRQLMLKKSWITVMVNNHPKAQFVTHSSSLTLGLCIDENFKRLSSATESEYALHPTIFDLMMYQSGTLKKQVFKHYKLHFKDTVVPIL